MGTNVADLLDVGADEASAHTPAVVDAGSDTRLSWSQLRECVGRIAVGLGLLELRAGQRVLIATGNRWEFVASYLGVLAAGLVAVPINPRSAVGEVARMLADSDARLVLVDARTRELVSAGIAEAGTEPRLLDVDSAADWAVLAEATGRRTPAPPDPEALAVLLYTSGTSARPRAAMLSHRALLANIEQVASVEPPMFAPGDVVLAVLPLFHVYGLNAVLGQALRQRACLVIAPDFDPEGTLDLIAAERVSVLPVAPPVLAYWRNLDRVAERLATVRLMLSGSAPLAPEAITEFEQRHGIQVHQGYGLTEAAPVVTSTLCSAQGQAGSVGAAIPGVEVRLREPSGREPERDDAGEIWIRGENLFSGYWPDGADGPDAEGWYSTGDVGFLDASGDLFLVDRVKELIIVSGFNVYPHEIEEVLREVDGVDAAAVIGIPDEHSGEAVAAFVVGATDDAELVERVRAHAALRLARFKQPTLIEVVDRLPIGATGKVQKGRLRARRASLGLLE